MVYRENNDLTAVYLQLPGGPPAQTLKCPPLFHFLVTFHQVVILQCHSLAQEIMKRHFGAGKMLNLRAPVICT